MERFPKTDYRFEVKTRTGMVTFQIEDTEWDQAGPVKIIMEMGSGLEELREYFQRYGIGKYGTLVEFDDPVLIPEDVHHILLMQDTTHHSELIRSQKLEWGFVPTEDYLELNDMFAGLMDD